MKKPLRVLLALITGAAMSSGCSQGTLLAPSNLPLVYKIDVQQGNVITQDMLTQLRPGMDKAKVLFIMGTPLVMDAFHQDRWDYIYTFQKGGDQREQQRATLYFKQDRLVRIEGDIRSARSRIASVRHQEITVNVPGEVKPGLMSRLKDSIGLGDETTDDAAIGRQEKRKVTEEKPAQGKTPPSKATEQAAEDKKTKEEQSFFSKVMEELERKQPGMDRRSEIDLSEDSALPP
jgi:outer membrane protein assembly factor BamE